MWERFRHADVIMERHQKRPREREHVVVVLGGAEAGKHEYMKMLAGNTSIGELLHA